MDFPSLARTYGYPVVVLGTMLQGEAILLICGFLAHQGYMNLWIVWIVAALSAIVGDLFYFQLGRHYGEKLLDKLPKRITKVAGSLKRTISRHPNEILLTMRFLFGTRILMPTMAGMSQIGTRHFMLMNAISALVWSAVFIGAGYLFGVAAGEVVHDLERAEIYFIVGIIAATAIYYYISGKVRERREAKEAE